MKAMHFLGILLLLGAVQISSCSEEKMRQERQRFVDDSIRMRDSVEALRLLDSLRSNRGTDEQMN